MKAYYEQIVLLTSIIKWAILATLVGVITGISTTIFLSLLKISTETVQQYQWYFLLLPLVFFTSSLMVKYLAPDAEGHGTEKIIEAVHKRSGKIKLAVVPVKLVATIITLTFGGSAGKEGPCAQIGAGLSSGVADVLRLNKMDRKKLVICGISAGFSTVFGTPIAGAIFAVEVLILGRLLNEYLYPALISAIMGFQTSHFLSQYYPRGTFFYKHIEITESLKTGLYFEVLLSGVFFGLVALLLIETVKYFEKLAHHLNWWKPLKGLLGGSVLILLVFIFGKTYLGLGAGTFEHILETGTLNDHTIQIVSYAFLLKIIFTAITLSFGGSGGILTPIFFIGVTSGGAFAQVMGGDVQLFAAIGLVTLLASATNTPIASTIMAIELFGMDIAPYAAISCVVGYIISGHRSVYPSQVIGALKSNSIQVPLECEFREVKSIKVDNKNSLLAKYLRKLKVKKID